VSTVRRYFFDQLSEQEQETLTWLIERLAGKLAADADPT